jgi:DNA mismatch endonuclease (patch repair protein)
LNLPEKTPFWHMHRCRFGRVKPATHTKFWQDKRRGNVECDKRNLRKLRLAGWKVLVVWECQIKKPEKLINKISKFLKK